jgi:hypothetical protein|tara:strand:- start:123 stop:866 length:744 start_codon:yes stop_codon:yes gene_type:complete
MRTKYISLIACLAFVAAPEIAFPESVYTKYVPSIDQKIILFKRGKKKFQASEGCGPVAAAMVLGYWQTQRGVKNLLAKGYTGKSHPYRAIRKLYKELKTKKAPGKANLASFTLPRSFYKGLKKRVKGKLVKVKRMRNLRKWGKRKAELKKQLKKKNPVILLKWKERKDGCLGKSSKGWNLIKNISYAHYFVAVGFKGKNVAIMPGWADKDKSASSSFSVHKRDSYSHAICTFSELKKANPGLFWLQR